MKRSTQLEIEKIGGWLRKEGGVEECEMRCGRKRI
jgi:hypothetical protein